MSAKSISGFVLLLGLSACPKPLPAVPTMATATKGLVVCWDDEPAVADERPLMAALKTRLTGAGYDLTSRICDVQFGYSFLWREDEGDKYYKEASLIVRDASMPRARMAESSCSETQVVRFRFRKRRT
jgi:hypothetical protein